MTKSDLIEQLATMMDINNKKAVSIVNTLLSTMTETLAKGDSIQIRGFGSFVVKKYKSYEGRNPKTGEIVNVKPKKLPFFRVGKELQEKVKNGKKSK